MRAGAVGSFVMVKAQGIREDICLSVFLVAEHIDGAIAGAEFDYGQAFDDRTGFNGFDGILDDGGAAEGADDILFAVLFVGEHDAHGCLGFPFSV